MQGIHLFTLKGIPVSFQPMFIFLILILSLGIGSVESMIAFGLSAVLGILIHEFGHAFGARHYGLNPEIVLCMWGGVTLHARPSKSRHDFFITLSGPVAGLIVAGILFLLLDVLNLGVFLSGIPFLGLFLWYLMLVNFAWGIFNLIPIHPMDGSRVLGHLLSRRLSETRVEKVMAVCSFLLSVLLLGYFMYRHNVFMIVLSGYFVLVNFRGFWAAVRHEDDEAASGLHRVGIQAESLYEKGLVAARAHDWRKLEMLGHQMKQAAEDGDQIARSYELLTIACTNLCKYEEALDYSRHARQSDAVRQAVLRCESLIR